MIASVFLALAIFISGKVLPLRPAEAPGGPLSDESLVAACALGDHAALGLLFDRHSPAVYRFLSRLIGPGQPDLEDMVQATFLEALRGAPQFRRQAAVQTWLLGIAANLARHHVRGEVRRRAALQRLSAAPEERRPRPEDEAARRQLLERLGAELQELPHDLRTAFVLCDVEEIPGVEVARTLGVPEGTLWRRLHEARRRLRGALGGQP